jgi:nucleotide-binding universal stress UspA family protein
VREHCRFASGWINRSGSGLRLFSEDRLEGGFFRPFGQAAGHRIRAERFLGGSPMTYSILIPLDGSRRAEKVLPQAEDMARRYQAEVILVKVDEPDIMLERDEVVDPERYSENRRRQRRESERYLAGIQERLLKSGLSVRTMIVYGPVVKAILETLEITGADLVAMASHGVSALPHQPYGSTAAGIMQGLHCPLLLVPTGQT